jgi:hypothetical protein
VLSSQLTSVSDPSLGLDTIRDFEIGRDKIDLSAIDADSTRPNDQQFSVVARVGTAPASFSHHPGELLLTETTVQTNNAQGFFTSVQGDIDGDALADFMILVFTPFTIQSLSANDFLL